MKCNYCNRELEDTANFCTYCGNMVQMLQRETEDNNQPGFVLPAVPFEPEQADPEPLPPEPPQAPVYPRELLSFRTVNYGKRRHTPTPDK